MSVLGVANALLEFFDSYQFVVDVSKKADYCRVDSSQCGLSGPQVGVNKSRNVNLTWPATPILN